MLKHGLLERGGQPYVTLDEKQVMGKEAEVLSGP